MVFKIMPSTAAGGHPHPFASFTRCLVFLLLTLCIQPVFSADWYIDGKSGADNNTGTVSTPFRNIWRGWQMAQAGDTIHILATTTYGPQYFSGKSGEPGRYITIQGENTALGMPRISGAGTNFGIMLDENTNYVRIKNFDVTAPGPWSAIYIKRSHHVEVIGNYTHDAGCAGIQIQHSDYSTVSFNRVANNSKDTRNNIFCSGISHHENLDIDSNVGTKMTISNNIVYNNTNIVSPNCIYPCKNSDGNGIIIDDSRRTQTDFNVYKGMTVVENNIVFNNGGRGVHVYLSDNVKVRNNTLYANNRDLDEGAWRPGELSIVSSGNVSAVNNIFFSAGSSGTSYTGTHVTISIQDCTTGGPIEIDSNLSFNTQNDKALEMFSRGNNVEIRLGTNKRWGDPLFAVRSVDPAVSNFQILANSPALAMQARADSYPLYDYLVVSRDLPLTSGAYQQPFYSQLSRQTQKGRKN